MKHNNTGIFKKKMIGFKQITLKCQEIQSIPSRAFIYYMYAIRIVGTKCWVSEINLENTARLMFVKCVLMVWYETLMNSSINQTLSFMCKTDAMILNNYVITHYDRKIN